MNQTLQPVTWRRKNFVTPCGGAIPTLCDMDESWRELRGTHERLRWARMHLTDFERPTDAARSLGIRPGTYRTYEQAKADGGRAPGLVELQRIAQRYKVSWTWLLDGKGRPDDLAKPELRGIADRLARVPDEKHADALRAVEAVLDAYAKTG